MISEYVSLLLYYADKKLGADIGYKSKWQAHQKGSSFIF
jgi:hypothetical protein